MSSEKRGVVLGVYTTEGEEQVRLTTYGQRYNEKTAGELLNKIKIGGAIKGGDCRIFWGLGEYPAVAVAGLGDASLWSALECLDGAKENVRIAAAAGAKSLLKENIVNIDVEDFGDAENAAVGAHLGTFKYQELKSKDKQTPVPKLNLPKDATGAEQWKRGCVLAEAQNFSKTLMEVPANIMTPTKFAETVTKALSPLQVECIAHDVAWAKGNGMNSFLSVGKGSDEPSVFLELTYTGAGKDKPFACFVGKGVTFDSGGISLKPGDSMDLMRGDMGGAACVSATIKALAEMKAKVNIKGLIPLCENMPSGKASKPGDIVTAMNGKTICVDNTDAEGRLILADALCYAEKFKPKYILDIATLTGAIRVALGDCVSGVFTNSDEIWTSLQKAGHETGDRVWRMPLFKHYSKLVTDYDTHDVNNMGKTKLGGACKAAAFLQEFVPKNTPWVHVDMASVMVSCTDQSYCGSKGMSGRPTRTLIEFALNH